MRVLKLEAIWYPPDGSRWQSLVTPDPDWPSIEAAVRRLDRGEWPFVWLHTRPESDADPLGGIFAVMGGRGEYDLCWNKDDGEWRYYDPARINEPGAIRIWESDQGAWLRPDQLCNDLDTALRVARYFVEHLALDPSVEWGKW